jgi:uncharacterized protein YbjT (DUF2867 family)
MNVLLFGATGMVGGEALRLCLRSKDVTRLLSVGRRKTGVEHPKFVEVEHENFRDFSPIERDLSEIDICLYCLGVYQAQVSKEKFWEITVDYLASLIGTLERASPAARFCLFSAQGASTSERSLMGFAKAKGRAENLLLESRLAEKYVFRPGYIKPGPGNANTTLSAKAFEPLYRLFPAIGVDAEVLANAMLVVGLAGDERTVLENRDIRMFAE